MVVLVVVVVVVERVQSGKSEGDRRRGEAEAVLG